MEDLIDRQAAIDTLDNYCNEKCEIRDYNWCPDCQYENFKKVLMALPTAQPDIARDIATIIENEQDMRVIAQNAQPERKKGKWIVHMQRGNWTDEEIRICPECGETFKNLDVANYCPNCGLPMEVEAEE